MPPSYFSPRMENHNTTTGTGNLSAVQTITVELCNTWNEHHAKSGQCTLLDDRSRFGTPWAVYSVSSIGHFSSGSMADYFSIQRGGRIGAHDALNVRNLRVNGIAVNLPAMGRTLSVWGEF